MHPIEHVAELGKGIVLGGSLNIEEVNFSSDMKCSLTLALNVAQLS